MYIFFGGGMSTIKLTKWGNSVGVRIPAMILKEAQLSQGCELEIFTEESGVIILKLKQDSQEGWQEQFNAIADTPVHEDLLEVGTDFDEEEWTW